MKGPIKLNANLSVPLWWSRDLKPGDTGEAVRVVQSLLLCYPSGSYDLQTCAAVTGFQVGAGIPAHGWVDDVTAAALGPQASDGSLPEWWEADLHPGDAGYEEAAAIVGGGQAAVRRFQGNGGLRATGVIDEGTARLIGQLV